MLKIVFLDFDGVLNSLNEIVFDKHAEFNRDAMGRLNDIVREANAKVVISSSWRVIHSIDELRQILKESGFQGEVIGVTPVFSHQNAVGLADVGMIRCREIQAWLDAHPHPVASFVCLDDLELEMLAHCHVKTEMEEGLCDHHVGQALAILG